MSEESGAVFLLFCFLLFLLGLTVEWCFFLCLLASFAYVKLLVGRGRAWHRCSCPGRSLGFTPSDFGHSHLGVALNHFHSLRLLSQLPRCLGGKEYGCHFRRHGYDSWIRKIPWRRKWQGTPVFLPGKFHGQGSLEGYSPLSCKESDVTEQQTASSGCEFLDVSLPEAESGSQRPPV